MANSRKRKSGVWEFFDKPEEKESNDASKKTSKNRKIPCKLCDLQLADGGGISNLMNHFQAKHPQEYRRLVKNSESARAKEKQIVLNHSILRVCNSQRAAAITERVATFVALDLRPMRVVEGMGFKQLMNYIEPGYVVPSRTHVASICRKKYSAIKEQLLSSLQKIRSVALTSDIRTSRAVQAYLTVTVITDDWLISSKVLVTREMTERHTGVHIADSLTEIAKDWNLEGKIVAVVHDNASNMVLAFDLLEDCSDLPCFAHTLQLAVNAGLEINTISRLSGACKKIVTHFKHSVVATTALRERQIIMNVPQHSLLQEVPTRWNSTYLMYERLAEQQWAIYAVIHDDKVTPTDKHYLDLTPEQWDLLSQMLIVLKPLQVATTALSYEQNVSSSLIYPIIHGLINCHLKHDTTDLPAIKRFKETVTSQLQEWFGFDPESIAILSSAVDPRYHDLDFLSSEQREEVARVLLEKIEKEYQEAERATEIIEEPKKKSNEKETAMSFLLGASTQSAGEDYSAKGEFERFKKEPQLHHDEHALEWWKKNHERFPLIAKVARQLLCVPATSVPSERIFSTAGLIVSNLRSSLKPENTDMLIFLNKNLPEKQSV